MAWIELTSQNEKALFNTLHFVGVEDHHSGGARIELNLPNARGDGRQYIYVDEDKNAVEIILVRAGVSVTR